MRIPFPDLAGQLFRKLANDVVLLLSRQPDAHGLEIAIEKFPDTASSYWDSAQITRATAGMRRKAAVVPQLRRIVPNVTKTPLTNPDSDAGSKAYCSQLTKA